MGILGIISFLSSIAFFSPAINVVLLPIAFYRIFIVKRVHLSTIFGGYRKIALVMMIAALGLSGIVYLLVPSTIDNFDKSLIGGVPYIWLIAASIFVGVAFDRSDLRAIVVLVCIEIAVGVIEHFIGVHSLISVKYLGETQIGDTDLLYYNRVFGLSSNSSVYAFKVLSAFAIVLAFKDSLSRKLLWVLGLILVAGFITSFNRTAIISAVVGMAFIYLRSAKSAVAILLAGLGAALSLNLARMFTRGEGHMDLSGRDVIFAEYYKFIDQHLIVGNACQKVWLQIGGGLYHAHNSYLELAASNGLIISLIFLVGYCMFTMLGRVRVAIIFIVFSTFQYGLLWGLTFNDVVFAGLMSVMSINYSGVTPRGPELLHAA